MTIGKGATHKGVAMPEIHGAEAEGLRREIRSSLNPG